MVNIYTLLRVLSMLLLCPTLLFAQSTSWKGTYSSSWRSTSNWTNGIPSSTKDAIIGDANFTGSFQPLISRSATARSLTLGGTKASTLTISRNLTVSGAILINSNGTMSHGKGTVTFTGNWTNNGVYAATTTSSLTVMAGIAQIIGGSVTTTYRRLTVNAGSVVTLGRAVNVTGSSSLLTVKGTFDPGTGAGFLATAGALTTDINSLLKVNAATFAANYTITGTTTLHAGSTVEYAAAGNQTVSNSYTYGTLRISGSGTKTLAGNLTSLASSAAAYGNIYVAAGTLDLSSFTANRGATTTGGTFTVLNGAALKIGGTNSFPANYATKNLGLTSTVEYSGTAQTVAALTYGNLLLTSSGGSVTKTFPATPFTIAGNLTSAIGTGTAVSFTAGAALTINGQVSIGASTTFNGGSATHIVSGNWTNNGTFTGNTSTITLNGAGTVVSGSGAQNFYNLNLAASNITAAAATSLNLSGDLSTTGAGVFTHLPGGTTTLSGTSKTVSGTGITLDNLTVSGSITTASTLTVTGNLAVAGTLNQTAGTFTMNGASKTISGAGTKTFATLSIPGSVTTAVNFTINSGLDVGGSVTATAGTVTFAGTSTVNGTANLFNVTLNGTSLQLAANATLGIAGAYTVTAGTLNVTATIPNTVNFNGTIPQSVNGGTYHHLQLTNTGAKTAGGAITTNGNFSIGLGASFAAGGSIHTVQGNWSNQGSFVAGLGTIALTGTSPASISGTNTFNTLTINKTSPTTVVELLNGTTAAIINMTSGIVRTGANTLTITNTRNGNGIITGIIQRLHAFVAGTTYAFESPNNTITFNSITVPVTNVTVAVTPGALGDFPFGSSINRVYNISIPSGTYTATLRLHYEDDELNGNAESSMPLWNYAGSAWANVGKTTNNTTNNYVELGGLSNIDTRWTLSDAPNVTRWTGAASSDWNTPGNWTAIQGSPGAVPTANDIVEIGVVAFTNQPAIGTAANAKGILFGSAQAATLTLNAGGSLTTAGNIGGMWAANNTHTINAGGQAINVNGDLTLSDGTAGHAINLSIGTGYVSVTGNLTQSGGANVTFAGSGTLAIGNNYTYSSGTFTPGTGTVVYNGANAQTVAGLGYNNLTINKSGGIAAAATATTIAGNFLLQGGALNLNANTSVTGNATINAGSILSAGNITLTTGGNWSNGGTFMPANSTVLLNGSGAQSVSASPFYNLTITKSGGTATLTGISTINNDLAVTTGSFDIGSFSASRSAPGGTFTLGAGATLTVGGAANFPGNYTTYNINAGSTVNYNAASAQSVTGVNYGNLQLSNGGTKTLAGNTTVNGNLTIGSGATFNGATYNIGLNGNWVNNGTFAPATSTVLLLGSSKTISGNTTFNRVTVYGSYAVSGSDITYNGLLNVTSTGSYDGGAGNATVSGDLINSGSLISNGVTTFSGTTQQTIRFLNALVSNSSGVINFNGTVSPILNSTSTPTYANLNINNTGGVNPSVNWLVLGNFSIGSGASFNGGSLTHTIKGNFTNNGSVTSSGVLLFDPATAVTVNVGSSFSSTGTLILDGSGVITLQGTPTSLQHVDIESTAGITPPTGWTMNGNFTVNSDAIFNAGANTYTVGGNIESNGILNGGTSTFIMTSATGLLTGSPGTNFYNFTITGNATANNNFQVSHDFTNNGTIDATEGELVMTGNTPGSIGGTTNPSNIAQVIINKGYNIPVTLARNLADISSVRISRGTFDIGTFTLTQDAVDLGELLIEDSATLKIGGTNTLPVFDSYVLDTLSTVDYAGSTQSIATNVIYGNLTVSAAGIKTPGAALTLLHDFNLSNGTFTGGNFTHLLGGDWNMTSGTYTNTGTTIQLNGVDTQYIASSGAFSNLTINKGSGPSVLASPVTINGTLTFTSGRLWLKNNNLTLGTAASVTGANATNYLVADNSGALVQTINGGSTKTYPVGTANHFIPATVAQAGGATTDNISVRVLDHAYTQGETGGVITNGAVDATWLVSEAVPGGSNATITLQWPGVLELPAFLRSVSRLAHFWTGGWEYGSSSLSASGSDPYTLSRSGFTSFSPFAVSSNLALPVTWLSVSAENKGRDNLISWSTTNETDNEYFAVEVSPNGADFTELGRVPGARTTDLEQHYSFLHRSVPYTTAWYRIKQVDLDGRYSYSKMVRVVIGDATRSGLQYVTSPARDQVTLFLRAERAFASQLVVVDAAGRIVHRQSARFNTGNNLLEINVAKQPAGIYFLQYIDEHQEKQVARFLKD
ncbi:hypothetical protein [Paraflavitalea sp. CAU 1676]|uniref:hypothetical protein n=1 Tax=Paraflavitalea sp. CAU 1676 TaxID=3032598 RepID=UPI0023DCD221|nr:hypothetical protein [Paraflavitalea sp. CAU 1676]MDF2188124.1 hypothetical protein [Paraflavitalea sp. CAU 1676]